MATDEQGAFAVMAGHGCDEQGPFLLLNDRALGRQVRFDVRGKTFSLKRGSTRRCIGRHDLETHEKTPCPLDVELPLDSRETACPACQKATGFNPSFYNADFVSPQQRAYNEMPHIVYLAYFAPSHVKAGICGAHRGLGRLLEQGARAACIVGRFDDAYAARDLEAALVGQPGILETMRAAKKEELLCERRYSFSEASEVLGRVASDLAREDRVTRAGFSAEVPLDLSSYYFGGPSPAFDELQRVEGSDDVCGGHCVGMVGSSIVFEQGGALFVVSLKDWDSWEVELVEGAVLHSYDFEPQQMSLL